MDWFLQNLHHLDFNPHIASWEAARVLLPLIGIDLLLSLDNALVIAMVARSLPERQQRLGILLGTLAAVALRLVFALVIAFFLQVWFVRLFGGLWLLWVAVKLLIDEGHDEDQERASTTLFAAMIYIGLADAGMSMDNVLALSAIADGNVGIVWLGVLVSIPLVMFGAELARVVINRFPALVFLGAIFLAYVAGGVFREDPALPYYASELNEVWHEAPWFFAGLTMILGLLAQIPFTKSSNPQQ